jgi:hypothetical protein
LQQSRDGINWMDKKTLQAAGNSTELINYQQELSVSFPYFRLIQFDLNGDSTVYAPISNSCLKEEFYFNVFPNPNNGSFQIIINHPKFSPDKIEIVDLMGRTLKSESLVNASINTILLYAFNEKLTPGSYLINIQLSNGEILSKKIQIK